MKTIINKVPECKTMPWPELKGYELNDLKQTEGRELEKLKNAMVNEGFLFPVYVWAEHRYVLDGAGRVMALLELAQADYDIPDIPIIEIIASDLRQAKKLVLMASSRHGEITRGSFKHFATELDLRDLEGIVDGIDALDAELAELEKQDKKEEPDCDPDTVPGEAVPISAPGDLFEIGPHRLLCGSATEYSDIQTLVDGHEPAMLFTDPPIGFDTDLTMEAMANIAAVMESGASFYICHAPLDNVFVQVIQDNIQYECRQSIIVMKNKKEGGTDYKTQHYCMAYGWFKGDKHKWFGSNAESTLWTIEDEGKNPAIKPVELMQKALKNSANQGDVILDPFAGCGSTMIACHMEGMICYSIELDPKYCDIIIARMKKAFPDIEVLRNGERI